MVDAVKVIATAQRLIAKHGRAVTLLQLDSTPPDPSKPWNGPPDPRATPDDTLDLIAVFVEPSSAVRLGLSAQESDLVKRSDQILIVSPGAAEDVRRFHEVIDTGESWKIEIVEILRPAEEILLAFIGVRR